MFAVTIRYYHPELGFEEACNLVSLPYGVIVGALIARAMTKDLPEAIPADDAVSDPSKAEAA